MIARNHNFQSNNVLFYFQFVKCFEIDALLPAQIIIFQYSMLVPIQCVWCAFIFIIRVKYNCRSACQTAIKEAAVKSWQIRASIQTLLQNLQRPLSLEILPVFVDFMTSNKTTALVYTWMCVISVTLPCSPYFISPIHTDPIRMRKKYKITAQFDEKIRTKQL